MKDDISPQNPYVAPRMDGPLVEQRVPAAHSWLAVCVSICAVVVFVVTRVALVLVGLFHAIPSPWDEVVYTATGWIWAVALVVGVVASIVAIIRGSQMQRTIAMIVALFFAYQLLRLVSRVFLTG